MVAMKAYLSGLTQRIADGDLVPAEGDVAAELGIFFDCPEAACEGESTTITTLPAAVQSTIGEISSGKNLVGKLAGNDAATDHKVWTLGMDGTSAFRGWGETNELTPEGLIRVWIGMVDTAATNRANNMVPNDPSGSPITKVFVSAEGYDLQQLLQKFLLGAVAFSQGADDYLDDDVAGKGLMASNEGPAEGKNYTPLEHNWDEGFGYFGAARDYASYTDDEIAMKGGRDDWQGAHDTNEDGAIDLKSEFIFGHAVNAGKRDRGHSTDLTHDAFHAFHAGRTLITGAGGALSDAQMEELKGHRDTAILAWEQAIAATVIHYINDVIGDMKSDDYDFYDHAKHWGEMKGFALSFQFNPRSPLSGDEFVAIHAAMGTAPELDPTKFEAYEASLLEARTTIQVAYGFTVEDAADW
jgi:hypothetical protein